MNVRNRGLHPERIEIRDAGDHLAALHRGPFLGDHPGEHARPVRARRGEVEQPPGVVALPAQSREVELHARQLGRRRALGSLDGRLKLIELDLGLARIHLGRLERQLRNQAVLAQLAVLLGAISRGLGVELLAVDLPAQLAQALFQVDPELLLLVGLAGELVLHLFKVQSGRRRVQLQDLVPRPHQIARPLQNLFNPRLDGAGDHPFERGHHRPGGLHDPLDRPPLHLPRPHLLAGHARPQPSRQHHQDRHAKRQGPANPSRPAPQAAVSITGIQLLIHVRLPLGREPVGARGMPDLNH